MSAELTEITQRDIALDFAGQVNDKLHAVGIKTAKFGVYDQAHQISVGITVDGVKICEMIRVGAPPEVVDEVVKLFSETISRKAASYMKRTTRRQRQAVALNALLTE